MTEPGETDEQRARLEQIQEHIDEARATAGHLADERVINPEEAGDPAPTDEGPAPRGN